MGGNGSRAHFLANTLEGYSGVRFDQVGEIDGNEVVTVSTQKIKSIPMESFTSEMYYITKPGNTNLIEVIAFYDKNHNISVALDLEFNSDGSLKPYREFMRKGKLRSEGGHMHYWNMDDNGASQEETSNGCLQVERQCVCFRLNDHSIVFVGLLVGKVP